MPKIVSLPDGVAFDVDEGQSVLEAALRANLPLTHACGGRAKCSTCRVWVLEGRDACPPRTARPSATCSSSPPRLSRFRSYLRIGVQSARWWIPMRRNKRKSGW